MADEFESAIQKGIRLGVGVRVGHVCLEHPRRARDKPSSSEPQASSATSRDLDFEDECFSEDMDAGTGVGEDAEI